MNNLMYLKRGVVKRQGVPGLTRQGTPLTTTTITTMKSLQFSKAA